MNVDALDFYGALTGVLWIALAVAIGVWVCAAIWVLSRAVSRRLERRYLPGVIALEPAPVGAGRGRGTVGLLRLQLRQPAHDDRLLPVRRRATHRRPRAP